MPIEPDARGQHLEPGEDPETTSATIAISQRRRGPHDSATVSPMSKNVPPPPMR